MRCTAPPAHDDEHRGCEAQADQRPGQGVAAGRVNQQPEQHRAAHEAHVEAEGQQAGGPTGQPGARLGDHGQVADRVPRHRGRTEQDGRRPRDPEPELLDGQDEPDRDHRPATQHQQRQAEGRHPFAGPAPHQPGEDPNQADGGDHHARQLLAGSGALHEVERQVGIDGRHAAPHQEGVDRQPSHAAGQAARGVRLVRFGCRGRIARHDHHGGHQGGDRHQGHPTEGCAPAELRRQRRQQRAGHERADLHAGLLAAHHQSAGARWQVHRHELVGHRIAGRQRQAGKARGDQHGRVPGRQRHGDQGRGGNGEGDQHHPARPESIRGGSGHQRERPADQEEDGGQQAQLAAADVELVDEARSQHAERVAGEGARPHGQGQHHPECDTAGSSHRVMVQDSPRVRSPRQRRATPSGPPFGTNGGWCAGAPGRIMALMRHALPAARGQPAARPFAARGIDCRAGAGGGRASHGPPGGDHAARHHARRMPIAWRTSPAGGWLSASIS